ncbi:MAG: hypothetical protein JW861_14210 [Bacteroidales bacterium]|nr:hypothetical protein [Bacteroidales bacterium]
MRIRLPLILSLGSLFLMVGAMRVTAQDVLHLNDGSTINCKVLEVGDKYIAFKLSSNPDGPDYLEKRSRVYKIVYQNGMEDLIQTVYDMECINYLPRNIFSYHLFDVVFNDFTLSYERISKNGKTGIRIPISAGYNYEENSDFDLKNLFYSGAGINFYPTGQGKFKYFMGPHIRFGLSRSQSNSWIWVEIDPNNGHFEQKKEDYFYGKLFIDNGLVYTPIPSFTVSSYLSLGIRYFDSTLDVDDGLRSTAHFSINLGYRF